MGERREAPAASEAGTFDRAAFVGHLRTRRLGRALIVRGVTGSTNDEAWEALQAGGVDGVAVVADAQTRGRGRAGRAWHTTSGRALALSIALHPGRDRDALGALPLVAGLALAEGLERLGVRTRLKWPNDLLIGDRKLAGLLCETRRTAAGLDAVVIGCGVNVAQEPSEFPPEVRDLAISLAWAGHDLGREVVAAEFLNALEPRWSEHQEGDRSAALEAWSRRADLWGVPVSVATPQGSVHGIAERLDPDGALVLRVDGGAHRRVLAGDVTLPPVAHS